MNPEVENIIEQLKEMKKIWAGHPCLDCDNNCDLAEPLREFISIFIAMCTLRENDLMNKNEMPEKPNYLQRMCIADFCAAFNAWLEIYAITANDFEGLMELVASGALGIIEKKSSREKLESTLASILKRFEGKVDWAKVLEKVKK